MMALIRKEKRPLSKHCFLLKEWHSKQVSYPGPRFQRKLNISLWDLSQEMHGFLLKVKILIKHKLFQIIPTLVDNIIKNFWVLDFYFVTGSVLQVLILEHSVLIPFQHSTLDTGSITQSPCMCVMEQSRVRMFLFLICT